MIAAALAANVAEIAPAAIDTDAGTVKLELFDFRATAIGVDPALAARATLHVELVPPVKAVGVQVSDVTGGGTTTPVAEMLVPIAVAALILVNESGFVGNVEAAVTVTFATTPSAIVF